MSFANQALSAEYVVQRSQFGHPIAEFQLTQYQLGRMAHRLAAARAITYAAAVAMDADERARRARALKEVLTSRDPGDWIDEQIADIRKKARGGAAAEA